MENLEKVHLFTPQSIDNLISKLIDDKQSCKMAQGMT